MKKLLFLVVLLIPFCSLFAQIEHPVKWKFSQKKISENKYELTFSATIDGNWHMYSTNIPEGGPVATSINYDDNTIFTTKGKFTETPTPETHHDTAFNMDLSYWFKKGTVKQIVVVKPGTTAIKGYVEFMTCDDHRCLPPDQIDFKLELKK